MRILLADDNQARVRKLITFLTSEAGVERSNIAIASTAMDARTQLSDSQFDLLILDVRLPNRPEDVPSDDTSIALLGELSEGAYPAPQRIVGITAFDDAAVTARSAFADNLWTLIQVTDTSDEWLSRVDRCIRYLEARNVAQPRPGYATDILVITALRDPEMRAVHALPWSWETEAPFDDVTFVRRGSFMCGGSAATVVTSVAPRMGMVATAALAAKLVMALRPRICVMPGICAGYKKRSNYGDVVLADPTWDYRSGKYVKDDAGENQFHIAPHQVAASDLIRARIEQMRGDTGRLREIKDAWPDAPNHELRLLVGPVASGSSVLADGEVAQELEKHQHRNVTGVEMELYGLYAAAQQSPVPQPLVMGLKAVCDFAGPDKDDRAQKYAAYTSANVLRWFAERYMAEIRSALSR